jgi:uncharacterized ferritin-like protein (DUF455 family)
MLRASVRDPSRRTRRIEGCCTASRQVAKVGGSRMTACALLAAARRCLEEPEPGRKVGSTHETARRIAAGELRRRRGGTQTCAEDPGRPERPVLVSPRQLPQRKLEESEGRAALVHAVAHIEFNAINLAWDAVQRFAEMPDEFARDWARVADDEARHFAMLRERLQTLGHDYGDFPAHDGLWAMARATAGDVLARMALVPRVLEARGLDVTPGMIERLERVGDAETAACLRIILREEVEHVAIGSRWLRWLCEQRGLPPRETYFRLLAEHLHGRIRCPLNRPARLAAGFDEAELARLEALCG